MNTGKKFEQNFRASVPDDFYYLRLNDPAQAFTGGKAIFAPHNPYDCIVFNGSLHCLELKSKNGAITFWAEKFERDGASHTFDIHKWQIFGLAKAATFPNAYAGFLMNFRNVERTFYVPINVFNQFVVGTTKKSINWQDAENIGIEVGVRKLKVNERYDVRTLLKEVVERGRELQRSSADNSETSDTGLQVNGETERKGNNDTANTDNGRDKRREDS